MLIDSGSTHNFLDPRIGLEVNFELQDAPVMTVSVANGEKLFSHQSCQKFKW